VKRSFDFLFSIILAILFLIPIFIIAIAIKSSSFGPVLHWSKRIGKNNKVFLMPKFRTMELDTPIIASHLLNNTEGYISPLGRLLRKSSFDELPQLWSILKGDMSFVGPRPALFNQKDLIKLRTKNGIHYLRPGLTGWAQINGRDDLLLLAKVKFDKEYLAKQSFSYDLKILFLTIIKVLKREGVTH